MFFGPFKHSTIADNQNHFQDKGDRYLGEQKQKSLKEFVGQSHKQKSGENQGGVWFGRVNQTGTGSPTSQGCSEKLLYSVVVRTREEELLTPLLDPCRKGAINKQTNK